MTDRMPATADRITDPVEKVRKFLADAGYIGEVLFSEETIRTVDDASRSVGAPPEEILKTLVLIADEEPVIALMSGPNRIDLRKVKTLLGAKRVSMAKPDWVLDYSGFEVGGVPPVGFPGRPTALLDEDLFGFSTVWAAAGTDHAFFPVNPGILQIYTSGRKGDIKKRT
ncbi:MAG: YbaK/EbsC family protein [Thermovirgaceae bacterium]|nr:YbaK/EbsC family protein [Thermovirgaceae bacterium]